MEKRGQESGAAFHARTREGFTALHKGNFQEAIRCLEGALELASSLGGPLEDEARVNLALALEEDGQHERAEEGLREILMRSSRDEVVFSAALTIARVRKSVRDMERSRFYLQNALAVAERLGDALRRAMVLNERANLLMSVNEFTGACGDYAAALEVLQESGAEGYPVVVALDNLGYALVLDDRAEEGVPYLERSAIQARRHGVRRYLAEASQDLAYALLKLQRPGESEGPARTALEVAEQEGYEDIEKNVLYLLGEAVSQLGKDEEARVLFSRLQRFYPGMPDLSGFLSSYDISAMVTLKEF